MSEAGAGSGGLRRFGRIDSTNRYLLDQARRGAPEGLWAVADHQTAGRGRLGRRWEAPPGASLLASVLFRPALEPEDLHLCTALVALAGIDACAEVAGVSPGVQWPNDLVVDDRKLAGVLAEADARAPGGPPGSRAVVVGIGVNVDWPGPRAPAARAWPKRRERRWTASGCSRRCAWRSVAVAPPSTPARVGGRWAASCGPGAPPWVGGSG